MVLAQKLEDIIKEYDVSPKNNFICIPENIQLELNEMYDKEGYNKFKDCDYMHLIGNSGGKWSYGSFTQWLLYTSRQNGIKETLKDVDQYLNLKHLKGYKVLVLQSAEVEEYKFCNKVELVKNFCDIKHPCLISPLKVPLLITKNKKSIWQNRAKWQEEEKAIEKLKETLWVINLAKTRNRGIQSSGEFTVGFKNNYPLNYTVWKKEPAYSQAQGVSVLNLELRKTDELLNNFSKIKNSKRLYIPLDRLTRFMSGESVVERAINLRILLESFLLSNKETYELKYRLALRAAKFQETVSDRKKIFELFKKLMISHRKQCTTANLKYQMWIQINWKKLQTT